LTKTYLKQLKGMVIDDAKPIRATSQRIERLSLKMEKKR